MTNWKVYIHTPPKTKLLIFLFFSVIPKQSSIFAFAVPLYSTLPPTHTMDMPLPLAPPFPTGSSTAAEIETVASLRKTVLDNPHIEFELYGNQFRFRSSDRAGKKFKHKESIELWAVESLATHHRTNTPPVNLIIDGPPLNYTSKFQFSQLLLRSFSILSFLSHTVCVTFSFLISSLISFFFPRYA